MARPRLARLGLAEPGLTGLGLAWLELARLGLARPGLARPGLAGCAQGLTKDCKDGSRFWGRGAGVVYQAFLC